jgi:hypothetical protein
MPFNGNGVFNRIMNWVNDAANSIPITASRTDTDSNDIAQGLTNCVTRDGQSPPLADLPMGGFKFTNVANAAANNQWVALGQANLLYLSLGGGTLTGGLTGTTVTMTGLITTTGNVAGAAVSATGNVSAGGTVLSALTFSATISNVVLSTNGAGSVLLRPNGSASSSGQTSVDSGGNMIVFGSVTSGGAVTSSGAFASSTANVVLASNGASGGVLLRPNGAGSSTGQVVIDSAGGLTLNGSKVLSKITVSNAAPGGLANGELYLQY